jgi:hypothetical protein
MQAPHTTHNTAAYHTYFRLNGLSGRWPCFRIKGLFLCCRRGLLLLPVLDFLTPLLLLLLLAQFAEATYEERDDAKECRKDELDEVVDHSH